MAVGKEMVDSTMKVGGEIYSRRVLLWMCLFPTPASDDPCLLVQFVDIQASHDHLRPAGAMWNLKFKKPFSGRTISPCLPPCSTEVTPPHAWLVASTPHPGVRSYLCYDPRYSLKQAAFSRVKVNFNASPIYCVGLVPRSGDGTSARSRIQRPRSTYYKTTLPLGAHL
ncbi:hypothetical protein BD779DRAFT_1044234 [Infundibulicybe gibba]|nr:hypothetical protein BD779DRAFT_1044234 [Infundibulicybe gibba]